MVTIAGYHFLECSSHIKKSSLVKHKRRNSSECPSCSLPYNESELSLSLKVNCDHFHCKSSSDILLNNSWVPENVFFFFGRTIPFKKTSENMYPLYASVIIQQYTRERKTSSLKSTYNAGDAILHSKTLVPTNQSVLNPPGLSQDKSKTTHPRPVKSMRYIQKMVGKKVWSKARNFPNNAPKLTSVKIYQETVKLPYRI